MAEKVTTMVIKVDLQCYRCYKKIKKVLCKFPQIRDQIYDEKNNSVTITVVCCSPEKIKQKICYKGGDSIKGIEILKPKPPPEKPKQPEKPKEPEKPKQPEKPPERRRNPESPKDPDTSDEPPQSNKYEKPKEASKPLAQEPIPVAYPIGVYCSECYEGHHGGSCFHGHGRPLPPPCYEGYGRPVYDSWGGGYNRGYYPSRCDYFCEENPSACTIM